MEGNNELRALSDIESVETFEQLTEVLRKEKVIARKDGRNCNTGNIIDLIDDLRNFLEKEADKLKDLSQEEIKNWIVKNRLKVLRTVTRTEGLRETVIQLLIAEVIGRQSNDKR